MELRTGDPRAPLPRKIFEFPLTSFILGVLLWVLALVLGEFLVNQVPLRKTDVAIALRGSITLLVFFAVYKLFITRLGANKKDDLPLTARGAGQLGIGALLGFAIFSLVAGIAMLAGIYRITGGGSTRDLVYALFATALLPGVSEEMLFRGIGFRWLEELGGSWFALVLTSAFFGLGHILNPNASAFSSFAIAVEAGVLFGGAYMLTRSLWFPVGLHAAWNFTQGEIFDVPVSGLDSNGLVQAQLSGPELLSGGKFGLEASLFALIPLTALGIWLVYRAVREGKAVRPWWVRRRLEREQLQRSGPAEIGGVPLVSNPVERA